MALYYRIWTDCILRGQSQPNNKHNWKVASLIFMSISMAFNLALFMIILQKFLGSNFYTLQIDFIPKYLNKIISFMILFPFPPTIINYLLVFRKNRYKIFMKKYPYYNGKLFITYFLVSMLLPLALLWTGIILSKI